jgi:hypothetical protein
VSSSLPHSNRRNAPASPQLVLTSVQCRQTGQVLSINISSASVPADEFWAGLLPCLTGHDGKQLEVDRTTLNLALAEQ